MSVSKEEVFLLSKSDYRDFDLVVNFLSYVHGKLSAVVYGGKKIAAYSSFPYNPGDLLEIEFVKRENRDFIKVFGVGNIRVFNFEKFPYHRFLFHSYLLEVVAKVSRPEIPAPELFQLLELNHLLEWTPEEALKFMLWAAWQIVKHGGYQIDFDSCPQCGRKTSRMSGEGKIVFRKETYQLFEDGRLICSQCHPRQEKSRVISSAMIKIAGIFESTSDFRRVQQKFPKEISAAMLIILNQHLTRSFEIRPKSLSLFLSAVKNLKS